MQLTVDRKLFRDKLAICARALCKSLSFPTLQLTLLRADAGRLAMTNADLDFSIDLSMDASVSKSGSLCADTERLLRFADNATGDALSLEVRGGMIHCCCGKAKARIPFSDASDYPETPRPSTDWHSIPANSLAALLNRTVFCISDSERKFSVKAVQLTASDEGWRAVATDGHRMSVSLCREANRLPFKCLLPERLCDELVKCLPEDGAALVGVDENNIFIRFGDIEICHRQILASFPDWQRVIPKDLPVSVEMESVDLLQALNCATPFIEKTAAQGHTVGVLLSHGEAQLVATSQGGTAEYSIPTGYDGEPYAIYFNAHYLRDPLKTCGKTVRLAANDPLRAATLVSVSDPDTIHVIFPQKP